MLFPGAAPCIRRLAARFPLAIASGALRSEIETVLSAGGLLGHFKAIISIEDVARGKPAPDPYLLAARQLGVPPAGCVAIEDAPGGIESAATAGLGVIGVTTSVPAEALAAAHLVVGSLDEITVDMVSRLAAGPRP
jgi:HAD superfamily hydrolase (TIGR01509 family)